MNALSGVMVLLSECFEKLMDGSSCVSKDRSLTWLLIDQPRQCKWQAPCFMTLNKTHPLCCLLGYFLCVLLIKTVSCTSRNSVYTIYRT